MVLSIGLVTAGLAVVFSPEGIGITGDSVSYLSAARDIVFRQGLAMVEGRPLGFSLAIAPFMCFGDVPAVGIRVVLAMSWIAVAALSFVLHRRWIGESSALAVALLVATNGVLMEQTRWALSEPVFCAVMLAALCAMERWPAQSRPASWRLIGASAALAGAAMLVRSLGVVLIACGCAALLAGRGSFRRRTAEAMIFAAIALGVPIAANRIWSGGSAEAGYWHWITHARPSEHTTAAGFDLLEERAAKFLPNRLCEVAECVVPRTLGWRLWQSGVWRAAVIGFGLGVMLLVVRRLALRSRVSDAFAILYFVVLMFWPWNEGVRLMSPLIPLFYGVLVEATISSGRAIGTRRTALSGAVIIASLLLAAHFAEFGTAMSRSRMDGARFAARMTRAEEIAEQLRTMNTADTSMFGLIRDGDDAKVDLELAGYLARQRIATIDCRPGQPSEIELGSATRALVHRRVVPTMKELPAWRAKSAVLDFVVFERTPGVGVAVR